MFDMLDDIAKRKEIIVCDYDNIIQIPDLFIINHMIKDNFKLFKEHLSISNLTNNTLRDLIARKEIDIIKWLSIKEFDYSNMYNKLYNHNTYMYKFSPVGEFTNIIESLFKFKHLDSIYILTSSKDSRKIESLEKIFEPKFLNFVNIIETDDTVKYVSDNLNLFTICSLYDINKIAELMKIFKNKGKCFLIPKYGFNFEYDEKKNIVPKNNIDQLARECNCEIGIYHPYVFKPYEIGEG